MASRCGMSADDWSDYTYHLVTCAFKNCKAKVYTHYSSDEYCKKHAHNNCKDCGKKYDRSHSGATLNKCEDCMGVIRIAEIDKRMEKYGR